MSAETRNLVLQRASELGYIRNNAATVLRGEPNRILGVVLPNLQNEFCAGLADALTEGASRADIQVMIGLSHDASDRERRAVMQLCTQQVGAIALVPTGDPGWSTIPTSPPIFAGLASTRRTG